MQLIERFMQAISYRITNGTKFTWNCFGKNAYCLDYWNNNQDGYSASITFDTETQTAYCLEVCDYQRNRAYRWINPDYRAAHDAEAKERTPGHENQAWDDVNYILLDEVDDLFTKLEAIAAGQDYDTNITVTLELDDETAFDLMLLAHQQDVTLNQLVIKILQDKIDRIAD